MKTNGWDVVFACSGSYINKQLAAKPQDYIQSFEYEDTAIKVSGTFGAWELVPGGSGTLLQFNTPITKGYVTIKSNNETISLAGTIPLVQLQLALIKGPNKHITHN